MLYKKSMSKHVTNWEFTLDNSKMYKIQPFAVDTCSWWLYGFSYCDLDICRGALW